MQRSLIILVLVLLSFVVAVKLTLNYKVSEVYPKPEIVVSYGQNLRSTLAMLMPYSNRITKKWFEFVARLFKLSSIKFGEYLIDDSLTYKQLLTNFTEGKVKLYSITLVEGWTFAEALAHLKSNNNLSAAETQWSVPKSTYFDKNTNSEGLIAADTYYFSKSQNINYILDKAHLKLLSHIDILWPKRAKDLPYDTAYEALTLASIIEKETALASERSKISGVFVRRLQINMKLQTDPTIIYGLGERYKGDIKRKHLLEKNAYNTYQIFGLPPTPIAIIGKEALQAALNPEPGEELFFVAKGDGSHYFSKTLEQHRQAVREYQINNRKKNYRSSPK